MTIHDAKSRWPLSSPQALRRLRVGFLSSIACLTTIAAYAQDTSGETTQSSGSSMIVVLGAGGSEEYTVTFAEWADKWQSAAAVANLDYHEIGRQHDDQADRDELHKLILQHNADTGAPLWIVLIGHGTYDRDVAKFNLRGPDISATELATWLAGFGRPLIIINSSSSSGPFLNALQGNDRVIITATNSGAEQNYSRFGGFLSAALQEAAADLDHDEQISLLEAFLYSSSRVARFYEEDSRLATEHALLEDNVDGKGTPANFFVGIRASKEARDGAVPDGRLAHRFILVPAKNAPRLGPEQIVERDRLEAEIEALRDRKASLAVDDYYQQLEPLLIDLARLYAEPTGPESEDAAAVN